MFTRLKHFFAQRHTPPFRHVLPNTITTFLAKESSLRAISQNWRVLKRYLLLCRYGQAGLLREQLPPAPARILWLNPSSTSIGDSLMELAGRKLLHPGYKIDLFTDRWNAPLYQHDQYFGQVFTDPAQIDPAAYDFVLLDLSNTRSIRFKHQYCLLLPFASLQGYFYGPDFNRLMFSVFRIHQLLGYPFDEAGLQAYLRLSLFLPDDLPALQPKKTLLRLAVAIGGVDPIRTYTHWGEVFTALWQRYGADLEIVLLGSANGRDHAQQLMAEFSQQAIVNQVEELNLIKTAKAISQCDFFLGADGGLMHIAAALNCPGIGLFGFFRPELRLSPDSVINSVFAENKVDDCPVDDIVALTISHLDKFTFGPGRDLGKHSAQTLPLERA